MPIRSGQSRKQQKGRHLPLEHKKDGRPVEVTGFDTPGTEDQRRSEPAPVLWMHLIGRLHGRRRARSARPTSTRPPVILQSRLPITLRDLLHHSHRTGGNMGKSEGRGCVRVLTALAVLLAGCSGAKLDSAWVRANSTGWPDPESTQLEPRVAERVDAMIGDARIVYLGEPDHYPRSLARGTPRREAHPPGSQHAPVSRLLDAECRRFGRRARADVALHRHPCRGATPPGGLRVLAPGPRGSAPHARRPAACHPPRAATRGQRRALAPHGDAFLLDLRQRPPGTLLDEVTDYGNPSSYAHGPVGRNTDAVVFFRKISPPRKATPPARRGTP